MNAHATGRPLAIGRGERRLVVEPQISAQPDDAGSVEIHPDALDLGVELERVLAHLAAVPDCLKPPNGAAGSNRPVAVAPSTRAGLDAVRDRGVRACASRRPDRGAEAVDACRSPCARARPRRRTASRRRPGRRSPPGPRARRWMVSAITVGADVVARSRPAHVCAGAADRDRALLAADVDVAEHPIHLLLRRRAGRCRSPRPGRAPTFMPLAPSTRPLITSS